MSFLVVILSLAAPLGAVAQPPDVIFKEPTPVPIPPMGIGDLNKCIIELASPQDACEQVCASQQKCALVCTYRLNAQGECRPYARCGDCAEVPPLDLPMDSDGGGDTR